VSTLLLRVEPHAAEPFRRRADGDALVVGRSSKADLTISDPRISRLQARLFRNGERWFIEDLGGRNPTLLNGTALAGPMGLALEDVIAIAGTRLVVEGLATRESAPSDGTDRTIFRPASDLLAASDSKGGDVGGPGPRSQASRLRMLNSFHRALAASTDLDRVLEVVLDHAFLDLGPEEAVIFLKRPGGALSQVAQRNLSGATDGFLYSRSLIHEVVEKGLAALSLDVSADARFAGSDSMAASGIRSLVAAPLFDAEGSLGMIALNSRVPVRRFSEDDLEELVSLAAAAALRIRNLALAEEAADRRALEKELSLARRIQMDLLPSELPRLAGFELHASNEPTRRVSGDLYQVQMRRDGRECVLLLVDVAGKGLSASLLTASLEAWAAAPIEAGDPPDEMCRTLSRRLYARSSAERYATGFAAVLDQADGRFSWANAGHNPALILRASGETEELPATGLPLGLFPTSDYSREERLLGPGDTVVIYTDGVTEVANPDGEEYGLERLLALSRDHAPSGVSALAQALQADLERFAAGTPFADDRTVILLRREP
jgi:phosphoserine phosphatase RsbU/P